MRQSRWGAENLTTVREKLVRIGAKVVMHANYVGFQLAEVAVPRQLFAAILGRIGRLRLACASGVSPAGAFFFSARSGVAAGPW
jgi:hypothetical protein